MADFSNPPASTFNFDYNQLSLFQYDVTGTQAPEPGTFGTLTAAALAAVALSVNAVPND